MSDDTIFARIVRGEIPADIVHQDELVTAFRDIAPQAPTHVLIVPNRIIPTAADIGVDDEAAVVRREDVSEHHANLSRTQKPRSARKSLVRTGDPDWLAQLRAEAVEQFRARGLPTR